MSSQEAIDASYEEDIRRNPYSLNNWRYYLSFKAEAPRSVRYAIYDRALSHLPRSYKLWHAYLTARLADCAGLPPSAPVYADVNELFERALIHMHKMPVIWRMFLDFQLLQPARITATRRNFDRALRALPVTQHLAWVWPSYLKFADQCGVPETAMRIWRRYVRLAPAQREAFVDTLLAAGQTDAAAAELAALVNDERFVSQRGKTRHDLWTDLLKLIVPHAAAITSLDTDAVLRSGIRRYPHEVARLWTALAEVYTRQGLFERARSIYAEALEAVNTVRDLAIVFDAYTQHEEGVIEGKMAELESLQTELDASVADESNNNNNNNSSANGSGSASTESVSARKARFAAALSACEQEVDLRMMRLDKLIASRPLLVNTVLLRQNPHNVPEWLNRVKLCGGDPARTVSTFALAVATVDPALADGQAQMLWARFAAFYQRHKQWGDARSVYVRAVAAPYPTAEALAFVWLKWAEMELAAGKPRRALAVLQRATTPPRDYRSAGSSSSSAGSASSQASASVYKNTRLWAFLADLQESLGPLDAARAVYERMMQLRVITPALLLNYAKLLEEHKHYEDAFRAYEKGAALFPYPAVAPVWTAYLRKFVDRYGGAKLERTRDLFEQALAAAPQEFCRPIYLLYAQFEERVGTPRGLMKVLARACAAVPAATRLEMYLVYLVKASEAYGAVRTRDIFDQALQALPDSAVPLIGARYAALERALGEIDRARGVYKYCAQYCDPKTEERFWSTFHRFELMHGNQDTFKDMLKARRAAKVHFEQGALVNAALAQAAKLKEEARRKQQQQQQQQDQDQEQPHDDAADSNSNAAGGGGRGLKRAHDAGADAEGGDREQLADEAAAAAASAENPDEIDLDMGFDDDDAATGSGGNGDDDGEIVQMAPPASLFGGVTGGST